MQITIKADVHIHHNDVEDDVIKRLERIEHLLNTGAIRKLQHLRFRVASNKRKLKHALSSIDMLSDLKVGENEK